METAMYTPSQVAKRANIHSNSVRNYSREYGEFLSAGARGEAGPRLYTDEDVDVLCAIAALRKSGVASGEVGEHLRQRAVIDVTPQEAPQALQMPTLIQSSVPEVYNALHARLDSLERRVDRQATERIERVWIFTAGMVAAGVIFILAWLVANSW
jgi:DNA-binding transcriptional MerR regulator